MTEESIDGIKVNGRSYRKPTARTVVICFDGCDPRYISHGLSAGLLPNISRIMSEGSLLSPTP
jgi:phosphonoacetate hydrolase